MMHVVYFNFAVLLSLCVKDKLLFKLRVFKNLYFVDFYHEIKLLQTLLVIENDNIKNIYCITINV